MNRYFELNNKAVCKVGIYDDTEASKADIDDFREYFKEYFNINQVREITKEQYKTLKPKYHISTVYSFK